VPAFEGWEPQMDVKTKEHEKWINELKIKLQKTRFYSQNVLQYSWDDYLYFTILIF
jgi:hypothetical protein